MQDLPFPRPSAAPPRQVQRLLQFIESTHPGTRLPGECAADWAIRLLTDNLAVVRLAEALTRAMGIDRHPDRVDGSTRPSGRVEPYQRRRQVVTAIQVEPDLANLGGILTLLPEVRYRIAANRTEVTVSDLLTGEVHLAWATDWLVRSPDGGWTVVENEAFYELYEPVIPDETGDS
jgi:hypothetical protein